MNVQDISEKDFIEKVIKSEKYVLVDFWAPWCMPCRMMAPILDTLSEDPALKDAVDFIKVNTEEPDNQSLAMAYNIQSIPNLKLFHKGEVVHEFIGLQYKDSFKADILKVIAK
jgi:thioredoxin 1